jgi:hypothetical protein
MRSPVASKVYVEGSGTATTLALLNIRSVSELEAVISSTLKARFVDGAVNWKE